MNGGLDETVIGPILSCQETGGSARQ